MAQSISSWKRKVHAECKNMSLRELSSVYFFRDPIRPIKNNRGFFYSPADGIILDCKLVSSVDETILTKYKHATLDELSYSQIDDGEYWVVTLFLTFYDPHIIRCPMNGIINRLDLPAYSVDDKTMLEIEKSILSKEFTEVKQELIGNIAFNQRVLFTIKPSQKTDKFYLLLTADYDIDTIVSFFSIKHSEEKQNTRIAAIRYGSMVTCVIPKKWCMVPVQEVNTHVEAGIDPLFRFI